MNRVARFVWAFIGTAAMQKGPLWWAGHHVNHHQLRRSRRRSAQPDGQRLLLRAHRLVPERHQARSRSRPTQPGHPRLLARRRRSRWLERYFFVPPLLLAVAMYLAGGLPWLVWGFCLPTMTLAHATFAINTVNHMFGSRRFETRRRVAQQRVHRVLRGRRRAGTTTTTAISARRATASTGGSSIRPGTSSARWRRSAWCGTSSRCRSGSTRKRAR